MRPVCLTCGIEYQCHKNGVFVKAGENRAYAGDQWMCPKCGHSMVCGFSRSACEMSDQAMQSPLVVADCTEAYNPPILFTVDQRQHIVEWTAHEMLEAVDIGVLCQGFEEQQAEWLDGLDDEELKEQFEQYGGEPEDL